MIRTSKHFIYIENQFFSKFISDIIKFKIEFLIFFHILVTTTENEENDPKYVIKNRIGEVSHFIINNSNVLTFN